MEKLRSAVTKAVKLGKDMQEDFAAGGKVQVRDVLEALVLSGQTRATHNETVFRQFLALAALQRVTAGGFSLGLDGQAQEGRQVRRTGFPYRFLMKRGMRH